MARIFISYRRSDSAGFAGRLHDKLLKFYDKSQIFLDVEALEAGADFESVIIGELDACEVFIAVIGPRWVDVEDGAGDRRLNNPGDYVRREVAGALQRDKTVVPVLVNRAEMPKRRELPKDMRGLCRFNAVELSHGGFDDDVERLVESIGGGRGDVRLYLPRGWSYADFNEVVYDIKIDGVSVQEDFDNWRRVVRRTSILVNSWEGMVGLKTLKAGRHTISARFWPDALPPDVRREIERDIRDGKLLVIREEKPTRSRLHTHPARVGYSDRVSFDLMGGESAKFTIKGRERRDVWNAKHYRFFLKRM